VQNVLREETIAARGVFLDVEVIGAPGELLNVGACMAAAAQVTKQIFEEGLGLAGVSLLKQGVRGLVDDIERLEPYFQNLSVGQE
jgi:hypothetical protein